MFSFNRPEITAAVRNRRITRIVEDGYYSSLVVLSVVQTALSHKSSTTRIKEPLELVFGGRIGDGTATVELA